YRGMCCSWRCLPQGPELHLDLLGQQEPVLLQDVSTRKLKGHELHLDLSTLQRPVLHTDMSTHWGLSCVWTCLITLIHMDQCLITVERVCLALKIICLLAGVFDLH
ncbi:MAG: hypothetical protein ACK56F_10020, partial [bacterium]